MAAFHIYVPLAVAAWMLRSTEPSPATECSAAGRAAMTGAHLFLEAVKPSAKDTVLTARLCLVPPKAGVGSYTATLTFDSTVMRAVRVDVSGGMQARNIAVQGVIKLAGAAPNGFRRGPLATIAFKPLKGTTLGKVRVTLVEANTPSGKTLLANSKVAGYPSTDRSLGVIEKHVATSGSGGTGRSTVGPKMIAPHVDSISPSGGKIDPESVFDVALYGKGFATNGNAVVFDAATVEGLSSENGGTVLRFAIPTMIPAHENVQLHRTAPGKFSVKVRTPAGTSNAVTFTVRGEDR